MRVIVTAGELIDRGVWTKACEVLGIHEWAVNEGQIDRDDEMTISSTAAFQLGLIKMNDDGSIEIKEEES